MNMLSLPASTSLSSKLSSADLFGTADAQAGPDATGTQSFGQMLQSALGQVSGLQDHAGQMATAFAQGKTGDIHSVMIASEQATMSLQLTTQIRNKAVDAYQAIMQISM